MVVEISRNIGEKPPRVLFVTHVVMPPFHAWLSPFHVALTGGAEKGENIIGPGIAPACLSRVLNVPGVLFHN